MVSDRSSSDVYAPNLNREPISDEDLIWGFRGASVGVRP